MIDKDNIVRALNLCLNHGTLGGTSCRGYWKWADDHKDIVAVDDYHKECPYDKCETGCVVTLIKDTIELIEQLSELSEPRHGEWKWSHGGQCSECGFYNSNFNYKYCPMCGAIMDEE